MSQVIEGANNRVLTINKCTWERVYKAKALYMEISFISLINEMKYKRHPLSGFTNKDQNGL